MSTRRKFMLAATFGWPLVCAFATPLCCAGQRPEWSLETFARPPKQFRGTATWGYDISRTSQAKITAGVDELAERRFGGLFATRFKSS